MGSKFFFTTINLFCSSFFHQLLQVCAYVHRYVIDGIKGLPTDTWLLTAIMTGHSLHFLGNHSPQWWSCLVTNPECPVLDTEHIQVHGQECSSVQHRKTQGEFPAMFLRSKSACLLPPVCVFPPLPRAPGEITQPTSLSVCVRLWAQILDPDCLGLSLGSAFYWLHDLRQLTETRCVSFLIKECR